MALTFTLDLGSVNLNQRAGWVKVIGQSLFTATGGRCCQSGRRDLKWGLSRLLTEMKGL